MAEQSWRQKNTITDRELQRIGMLLCDHSFRDLALMVVRLEGELEVCKQMLHPDEAIEQ